MAAPTIRTRFAPSPTGHLHVGGIRTALYNWLYAKHTGGIFFLRIEDTDRARVVPDGESQIKRSLEWLGLEWHSEVMRQSDRAKAGVYRKYAQQLVEQGHAYVSKEPEGDVVRLRWPDDPNDITVAFFDTGQRHHERTFRKADAPSAFEDFVLIKSDGFPTYNFAHVIDDHELGITQVIRGDEFVSSLNKYVYLYDLFGWQKPQYVHVPPILGPDGRKKLSKREGDRTTEHYRERGILPEALANFVALIGWSPGQDRELFFSLGELAAAFELDGLQNSPGAFDDTKLSWMNAAHLRNRDVGAVLALAQGEGFWPRPPDEKDRRVVTVELGRVRTLAELRDVAASYYFDVPKVAKRNLLGGQPEGNVAEWLERSQRALSAATPEQWTVEGLEGLFTTIREELRLTPKQLYPVLRTALTGADKTPAIWELAWALGQDETLARLEAAAALVS